MSSPLRLCASCSKWVDSPQHKLCSTCRAIPPANVVPLSSQGDDADMGVNGLHRVSQFGSQSVHSMLPPGEPFATQYPVAATVGQQVHPVPILPDASSSGPHPQAYGHGMPHSTATAGTSMDVPPAAMPYPTVRAPIPAGTVNPHPNFTRHGSFAPDAAFAHKQQLAARGRHDDPDAIMQEASGHYTVSGVPGGQLPVPAPMSSNACATLNPGPSSAMEQQFRYVVPAAVYPPPAMASDSAVAGHGDSGPHPAYAYSVRPQTRR